MQPSNLTLCYEGIQRIYRNSVVRHIRLRLKSAYPEDFQARLKKPFKEEEWEAIKESAYERRGTGEVSTDIIDDFDLLGVNHFFNIFELYYDALFEGLKPTSKDQKQKERQALLQWMKTVKSLRDPLSHPSEQDFPFEDSFVLLDCARRVLLRLRLEDEAKQIKALTDRLGEKPLSIQTTSEAAQTPVFEVCDSSTISQKKAADLHSGSALLARWPPATRWELICCIASIFCGAFQAIMHLADWLTKGQALLSLFGSLPAWADFLGHPLIGVTLIVGGFAWLAYLGKQERERKSGRHVLQADGTPFSGKQSPVLPIAFLTGLSALLIAAPTWWYFNRWASDEAEEITSANGQQTATRTFTMTILPADTPLREMALLLSEDILKFLVSRVSNSPPYPKALSWTKDMNVVRAYDAETLELYASEFGLRVKRAHDDLAMKALRDPALDELYDSPENILGIKVIAKKIRQLAEQLPEQEPRKPPEAQPH